jgi:hypothetical protein
MENSFTSLKDASYQGCKSSEFSVSIGKFIYDACPTFLDKIPEDIKSEIESGQMIRFNELHPAQYFTKDYVPCDANTKGAFKVDINVVMSFSQQEFGRFKSEDPIKHSIHKQWRDDWSTYKSNRLTDLKKYVRAYKDKLNGVVKERAPSKDFIDWLKDDWLDTLKTRHINAKKKGDATCNDAIVQAIIKAIK